MPASPESSAEPSFSFVEEVEISGHIIDSLLLPKVLDLIMASGGTYQLKKVTIGQSRQDPSYALIDVSASTPGGLAEIIALIGDHGASPTRSQDCQIVSADMPGAFPEGFYSTTNQRTEIRIGGAWRPVADQEMDCGIVVSDSTARCIPMTEVAPGMSIVVGHTGVRVFPIERPDDGHTFTFMDSDVSTEKPKGVLIRQIAEELIHNRRTGKKSLLVGGPAIVHTGSGPLLCELIRGGYIHRLFAGNALATHDVEQALFGTSLGVQLRDASIVEAGHEHHLRAINRIRREGSIRAAIESGTLQSGVIYECVTHGVDFLLAGSIRDDGPLPEVITDALEAQRQMRAAIRDVSFCLMIATTLHSIAVGNLLPAWVKVVCVDINPSTVIKLNDRGSFQTVGIVTDVEPFLRALVQEVKTLEQQE